MPCQPSPPCEPTFPIFCEPLPQTNSGKRVVVEDMASCQKTIPSSPNASLLHQRSDGNLIMADASNGSPIKLPQMSVATNTQVPKIMVLMADGTIKAWQPSFTGDSFIAYWDGTEWKLGDIETLLPVGNGVLVKDTNGVVTFVNGSAGESLQYSGTNIVFGPQTSTPVPTGMILPFAGPVTTAIPFGYLECDGAVLAQATYINLFATIGGAYNIGGEGSGNFRLPDLRGYFIRGFGTNIDTTTSGAFAVKQSDTIVDHTHSYINRTTNVNRESLFNTSPTTGTTDTTTTTGGVSAPHGGGTETRPKNIAMRYVIKT